MGKEEKLSALAAGRDLYDSIRSILLDSRARAHAAVNSAMVLAYWQIGRAIVEDEQEGQKRGAYGKGVLKGVSERLTASANEEVLRPVSKCERIAFAFDVDALPSPPSR